MLLATALACLLQDVLNRRLLAKQTGNSSTRNHHHHFFVSGVGRRKLSVSKFVAAQKMLLKQKQQTFVNGCSVLSPRHYTPLEARV